MLEGGVCVAQDFEGVSGIGEQIVVLEVEVNRSFDLKI
jgi:hypothetical protein